MCAHMVPATDFTVRSTDQCGSLGLQRMPRITKTYEHDPRIRDPRLTIQQVDPCIPCNPWLARSAAIRRLREIRGYRLGIAASTFFIAAANRADRRRSAIRTAGRARRRCPSRRSASWPRAFAIAVARTSTAMAACSAARSPRSAICGASAKMPRSIDDGHLGGRRRRQRALDPAIDDAAGLRGERDDFVGPRAQAARLDLQLRHDAVELRARPGASQRLQHAAGREVARHLQLRQARPRAVLVALRLPPAVFGARQAVMAGEAIELGVLRPDRTLDAARDSRSRLARRCTSCPTANVRTGLYGVGVDRLLPVPRHRRAERFELEHEIGMAGGDHLVIHELLRGPEMAGEALVGALHDVLGVVHAALDRLVVRRVARDVIAEPARGRAVARLAAHALGGEVAAAQRSRARRANGRPGTSAPAADCRCPRMRPMRCDTMLPSTSVARAWRSCETHVLYSVWRMRAPGDRADRAVTRDGAARAGADVVAGVGCRLLRGGDRRGGRRQRRTRGSEARRDGRQCGREDHGSGGHQEQRAQASHRAALYHADHEITRSRDHQFPNP